MLAFSALACSAARASIPEVRDDNPVRVEDEEPNQRSTIAPVGPKKERPPAFFADAKLVIKPRSYYLYRDQDVKSDLGGWALGGALEVRSGWWADRIQLSGTAYTSQKLWGPSDKDGTGLFKPGQDSFTVLGEANATVRFVDKHGMVVGRQILDLPYLGRHDIRMVPNTFDAIAFGNRPGDGFAYLGGYVDEIKLKDDDKFIPMSQAAGAEGSDEGMGFAGVRYRFADGAYYGAIYQHTFDTFGTFFAVAEQPFVLGDDLQLWVNASYTDQRSVEDELIGDFETDLLSAKFELVSGQHRFRLGASTTDNSADIRIPFGNPANYLSVIVNNFDRAGEDAIMLGYSRDVGRVGHAEVGLFTNVVIGDTPDSGPNASPDQVEYNVTADFRVRAGWGDRLWVRVRGAWIDEDNTQGAANDFFDFRIIVNYDFTAP